MFSYTIVRSRRKTIAIHIKSDATVVVHAPLKMPGHDIDKFVASKEKWILSHLDKYTKLNDEKRLFLLNYGDTVTLCGKAYPIEPRNGKNIGFDGKCFYLPPDLPHDDIKFAIIEIYKMVAKHILTGKVVAYAKSMNVRPTAVKVNSAKTRWGSCSGKNSINFSWRLIMADESIIDYVIVHELAHIREHNHSPRFWAIVEEVLPDYGKRRQELKAFQDKLSREDWG